MTSVSCARCFYVEDEGTHRQSRQWPIEPCQPLRGRTTSASEWIPTTASNFELSFKMSCWMSNVMPGVYSVCVRRGQAPSAPAASETGMAHLVLAQVHLAVPSCFHPPLDLRQTRDPQLAPDGDD